MVAAVKLGDTMLLGIGLLKGGQDGVFIFVIACAAHSGFVTTRFAHAGGYGKERLIRVRRHG